MHVGGKEERVWKREPPRARLRVYARMYVYIYAHVCIHELHKHACTYHVFGEIDDVLMQHAVLGVTCLLAPVNRMCAFWFLVRRQFEKPSTLETI